MNNVSDTVSIWIEKFADWLNGKWKSGARITSDKSGQLLTSAINKAKDIHKHIVDPEEMTIIKREVAKHDFHTLILEVHGILTLASHDSSDKSGLESSVNDYIDFLYGITRKYDIYDEMKIIHNDISRVYKNIKGIEKREKVTVSLPKSEIEKRINDVYNLFSTQEKLGKSEMSFYGFKYHNQANRRINNSLLSLVIQKIEKKRYKWEFAKAVGILLTVLFATRGIVETVKDLL